MHLHTYSCLWMPEDGVGSPGAKLQVVVSWLTSVWGTELEASGRAASALKL